jgi:ABC-type branched-subunit amino acid transport system ATPase component
VEPRSPFLITLGNDRLAGEYAAWSADFPVAGDVVTALDRVDLEIPFGGMTVVAGPSGSGKSTLLSLLACTQRPDEGSVRVGDTEVLALSRRDRRELRRDRLGIVLPQPSENLLDQLDAAGNIRWAAEQRQGRSTASATTTSPSRSTPWVLPRRTVAASESCRAASNNVWRWRVHLPANPSW